MLFSVLLIATFASSINSQNGDDVTSSEEASVQDIILPMCKDFLPYTKTKLPNSFGHSTQVEVYRNIEHYWAYMDYGCSTNFRLFICSMYLPKYEPETSSITGPCRETCNKARSKCKSVMQPPRWPRKWRCKSLPSKKRDATCFRPLRESRANANPPQYCTSFNISQCQALPYNLNSLPNLFYQRDISDIRTELNFYDPLLSTQCSPHLSLFLCGTYIPFCSDENPFMTPCRELCEQVQTACLDHFRFLYGGLPWPNKLQCHRFPSAEDDLQARCFMPPAA